jgi:hypothetical protein
MEGTLSDVPFIRHVVSTGALREHPLALLDIGCSGGLDRVWRDFEPALVAHGVDPMPLEVARLRANERNPQVQYHCAFLRLPPDHPFIRQRGNKRYCHKNPWAWYRTSTNWGCRIQAKRNPKPTNEDVLRSNAWHLSEGIEATPTLTPAALLDQLGASEFDFIKIDVDGPDFEILLGLEDRLASVLGMGLEVNFIGTHLETDNTFHNVDRFMRKQGFTLVSLTNRPYSRAALPAPFQLTMVAQTAFGPPLQGDAIYIRDLAARESCPLAATFGEARLLKLACLYALCNLPDCAAEVLLRFRKRLETRLDIDQALDLLTPPMADGKVTYKEYVARFTQDMEGWFFPPYQPASLSAASTPVAEAPPVPHAEPAPPAPQADPPPAAPTYRIDPWRSGKFAATISLAMLVGVFFAEAASQGRIWPLAVLFAGLFLWAGCSVMARIPNKKRALRKIWKAVRNGPAAHTR